MAQQLLVNGETYGSHRNKVNANETELYAAAASAQAVANAALPAAQRGVANGVASLDGTGKVPSGQLPAAAAFTLSAASDVASFDLGTTNTSVAAIKATANAAATAAALTTTNAAVANKISLALGWNGTTPALSSGVNPVTAGFGSNAFVYTGAGTSPTLDGVSGPNGTQFIFGYGGTTTWSAFLNGAQYLGIFATSGSLPASPAAAAMAYVGASAPYAIWQYNGSAWVQQVTSAMVAAASGVASLDSGSKVPLAQMSGVLALANLSDGAAQLAQITTNTNQTVQVGTNITINTGNQATYNGKTLEFGGAYTVTISAGLANDFGFAGIPPSSGNASIASDGTTTLNGATSTLTRAYASQAIFTVTQRSTSRNAYVVV